MREEIISFGPFRFSPTARTLDRDGEPLALGSRALDVLAVLIERAGEVVSHRELMATVWRDVVVDGGNLRVNIAQLRKVLGEAGGFIQNVPRQGYRFAAPVFRSGDKTQEISGEVRAVLDCSYGLLSEVERLTLCRLTIFVGEFTLEAARFVVRSTGVDSSQVAEAVDGLVAKSLLRVSTCAGGSARYRMLDIARAYGRRKLEETGEAESVARRHAEYFARPPETPVPQQPCDRREERDCSTIEQLRNLRAALQWCLRKQYATRDPLRATDRGLI